jgi:hypothetical protein
MAATDLTSAARRKLLEQYLHAAPKRPHPAPLAIPRRASDGPAPLSYGQEQVWLHNQMAPGVMLYNEPVTILYRGPLDPAVLERSFNEILRRHEAWRTSIREIDGRPMQFVEPNAVIAIAVDDLRHLPRDRREPEAIRLATEDARRPFDPTRAPLLRARLVTLDRDDHRLYLALCHIIFDGVAMYRVFLPELAALCEAYSKGAPSPLPELTIQYPDFACWQQREAEAEANARHLAYWRKQLSGAPAVCDLPLDRPRPAVQTFRGAMYPFGLDNRLTEAVRSASVREKASPFHLLLAAFAALLHRYSGQDDYSIGTVTGGREGPQMNALLGYFITTVVLRLDFSGGLTFRELMAQVRRVTLEALEHDGVPFRKVIEELHPKRDPSYNPLFQVMFTLEPPMPELPPGWDLSQKDVDTGATKYDLYLETDERRDAIMARFHYATDLFDESTVARMAANWLAFVESAVADPGTRIADLPFLAEEAQPDREAHLEELFDF